MIYLRLQVFIFIYYFYLLDYYYPKLVLMFSSPNPIFFSQLYSSKPPHKKIRKKERKKEYLNHTGRMMQLIQFMF